MNIRFRMKQLMGFSALSAFIGMAGSAQGANELELSDIPLFLGDSVVPNVYIEMDDSGSMDWDVLSAKYWHYCAYDSNTLGNTGDGDCGWLVANGLLRLYAKPSGVDDGSFQDFYYIFDSPDDAYSHSCTGSRQTLELCGDDTRTADWRARSAAVNVLYYNPTVSYTPWLGMDPAVFNNARSDPQPGTDGYESYRNLGTEGLGEDGGFTYHVWQDQDGDKGFSGDRPRRGTNLNYTEVPNGQVDLWDSHIEFNVTEDIVRYRAITYAPDGTGMNPTVPAWIVLGADEQDPVVGGLTPAQIRQNIANWYQYGRRRSFVAKGAVGAVVDRLPDFRYGLSVINDYSRLTVNLPTADVLDFTDHNDALVDDLYSFNWPAHGTPLRNGLKRVGEYYKQTGSTAPIIHACQQNFTVLFTDGYWNGGSPSLVPADADQDTIDNTLADVARTYYTTDLRPDLPNRVPVNARDQATTQHMVTFTVAFGIEGNLKDTTGDGAPDQNAAGNAFTPAPDADWGNPSDGDPEKVDDLWHAAFNSTGSFVAADTPQEVVWALVAALRDIERRSGSAASVALNSGSLGNDTHIYQARFESSSWGGQLLAFPIDASGALATEPVWDAAEKIDNQSHQERVILSYDPEAGNGIKFRYEAGTNDNPLTESQMVALMADAPNALPTDPEAPDYETEYAAQFDANKPYVEALVNFLRGDRTHEGDGDTAGFRFRERAGKLSDVVHSDPVYVGPPNFRYPDQWRDNLHPLAGPQYLPESAGGNEYSGFRESKRERTPLIYFGANDGMLHGINATDDDATGDATQFSDGGAELLAYVPSMLYKRLPELASRNYIHKYYVDGGPTVVDAFVGSDTSGAWRTVLVGGLAGGGQGIYALDVTNPAHSSTGFAEDNASNIVMWEFSDTDDVDLGYTYSKPAIVRMHNGKWATVFGNGYNNTEADGHASTSGNAVLYIVDLANGSILKKIDTLVGAEGDPTNNADEPTRGHRPNGLATTAPVDLDGDGITDYIYAGDLFGNLWKFDVTSNLTTDWKVAEFPDRSGNTPLFQATIGEGENKAYQPITSRPEVGRAPQGKPGVMVYFGTGQYLELTDNTPVGQETQTFYGIWDNWAAVELVRGAETEVLQKQEIILEQRQTFLDGEIPPLFFEDGSAVSDPESLFTADGDRIGNAAIFDENGIEVLNLNTLRGEFDVRASTDHSVDWEGDQKGWYMDLIVNGDNQGERQVSPSVLRNNRIIFATLLPSNDPCEYGGDSWLMELDAFSGSRLPYSPFDFNLDGVFDAEDYAELPADDGQEAMAVPASGKKSKVGIIPTPAILSGGRGGGAGDDGGDGPQPLPPCAPGAECKLASGSTGKTEETRENPGKGDYGRQSWREL